MKEDYYVIFSSVTIATGVKKLLERRGITAILMHTPKALQLNGCSYSLKIKEKNYEEVLNAARSAGADVLAVYKATESDFREVKP